MDIGKRIKYYRVINNMSQKNLADLLHVAVSTISNWENGRNQVGSDYYEPISRVFNISVSDLLDIEIKPQANASHLSSRPYLSYQYHPSYGLWLCIGLVIVFSMLSGMESMLLSGLLSLSWIILLVYTFASFVRNSHQNLAIKYYKDHEKLYYLHQDNQIKIALDRRVYILFSIFLHFSINVAVIIGFSVLLAHSADSFNIVLFPIALIVFNLIMAMIMVIDGRQKYKGKQIEYTAINHNFFLARNKLLLFFYGVFYFIFFIEAIVLKINIFEDFGFILLSIVMSFNFIGSLVLLEMNYQFYKNYQINVK
jgi:transcriptional regulator with XRE-family HTH domain